MGALTGRHTSDWNTPAVPAQKTTATSTPNRSAPGVASEVEAIPASLGLQPRARLGAVETVPEAPQLVLDERIERISASTAGGCNAGFS
jgi:hypothetical protein